MNFDSDLFDTLINLDLGELPPFLTSDMSVRTASKVWLRQSILKKYVSAGNTDDCKRNAIDLFLESNRRCAAFRAPDENTYYGKILAEARDKLHRIFLSGPFQTNRIAIPLIVGRGRPGPGASVGTKFTDFHRKMFASTLTTTSYALYRQYIDALSDTWSLAEFIRFSDHGVACVQSSKLSTVPKSNTIDRTICTEPSLNMFFQLGCGSVMEDLLNEFFNTNLSTQPDINRHMARLGSTDDSKTSLCTIDLKSASDTISYSLVKYLLPPLAFDVLNAIRSPSTNIDGTVVKLDMISSMGNGFTFPLQTLIFSAIIESCYEAKAVRPRYHNGRNIGVFGDDMVVSREMYHTVIQALQYAGFIVNDDKSFAFGPFRESCGKDFFKGHDIRGVYLKEINETPHIYSLFNRLLRWSCKHDVPLYNSLRYLKGLVNFRPIPWDAGDSEGIKCPSSRLTSPKRDANGAVFYRALVVKKKEVSLNDEVEQNPFAGKISAIGGYVRDSTLLSSITDQTLHTRDTFTIEMPKAGLEDKYDAWTKEGVTTLSNPYSVRMIFSRENSVRPRYKAEVRQKRPRYEVVRRKTPNWDYMPYAGLDTRLADLLLSLIM